MPENARLSGSIDQIDLGFIEREVTPDVHLNRPLESPLALHKRQIYPRDTLAEAFEIEHGHSEIERLTL